MTTVSAARPLARWPDSKLPMLVAALIGILAAAILYRAQQSNGFYWSDDYSHLLISRRALHERSALLDVWGRPLMTAVYLPAAAAWGILIARATTLVLFAGTAVLCTLIARRQGLALPSAVAFLLLAEPLAARISYSAMTQTVFSFVLALALWLRVEEKPVAAAAVASLLPLARLEGLFVLGVWAVVLLFERRHAVLLWLGAGMATWAFVGAIVYNDRFWIWHANPYGILGSPYPTAGWTYVLRAIPAAFGPLTGGLAIAALAKRRLGDPLIAALVVGMPLFYAFAWGVPAFRSLADPVYLVSASVPTALFAHRCLASLLDQDRRPTPVRRRQSGWIAAIALVIAIAAIERDSTSVLLVLVAASALAYEVARPPELRRMLLRLAPAFVATLIVVGAASALSLTTPLPLQGTSMFSKQLVTHLGDDASDVALWTDPAVAWYARRSDRSYNNPNEVPIGGLAVWDSHFSDYTRDELVERGFTPIWEADDGYNQMVLYRRDQIR